MLWPLWGVSCENPGTEHSQAEVSEIIHLFMSFEMFKKIYSILHTNSYHIDDLFLVACGLYFYSLNSQLISFTEF